MPFEIVEVKKGLYKVCKKDKSKCFSKKGLKLSKAKKQLKAIGISEGKMKGGSVNETILEGLLETYFDTFHEFAEFNRHSISDEDRFNQWTSEYMENMPDFNFYKNAINNLQPSFWNTITFQQDVNLAERENILEQFITHLLSLATIVIDTETPNDPNNFNDYTSIFNSIVAFIHVQHPPLEQRIEQLYNPEQINNFFYGVEEEQQQQPEEQLEDPGGVIVDIDNIDNDATDPTGGKRKKLKMLELFKGTGSVGKVAKKMGFEVVSLDLDPIYTPDIETDILKWDYKKWAKNTKFIPDFIWSSPPCNTFSPLAYPLKERDTKTAEPKSDRAKEGTKILHKTLEIINYFKSLNPNMLYTIENPRGMMRHDEKMLKLPNRETTLYCLYGDFKRKPTDFWSNFKMNLDIETKQCKNETINVTKLNDIKDRYSIPSKLINQILKSALFILNKKTGGSVPLNMELYNKIKNEVYKKNPKHSLYRSALIQKIYQSEGGKYKNGKKPKMDIKKWFKQKWISLNDYLRGDIIQCGNSDTEKKFNEYPLCRPLKIAELMTEKDMKKLIDKKNKLKQKPLITKKVLGTEKFNIKPTITGKGKFNYDKSKYLKIAKSTAKQAGYNPKLLKFSDNPKKKLNYNGVDFGASGYGDYIIYKLTDKKIADKKRDNYRKRAEKVMKKTNDKFSPASLSYYILW